MVEPFPAHGTSAAERFGRIVRGGDEQMVVPAPTEPVPPLSMSPLSPPMRVMRRTSFSPEDHSEWEVFKRRFVSAEGRVVDTGNGGVSHSEGQGWGMLFAVAFDDPETFDLLHDWTARTLKRSGDSLHAWRFLPRATVQVPDQNNAADADLFIAAALWRAAWQWGRPDHAVAARAIAQDILGLLVRETGPRTVLLPGASGFELPGALTINPSYYVYPVLEEMESLAPSPKWARLRADGISLLQDGRFGRWHLPPDWLRVDRATGALTPHPNWPARFSYDAIRVPLWLAWSRQKPTDIVQSFSSYWTQRQAVPAAWIDLKTDTSATYPAPPGMVAVGRIATALSQLDMKVALPIGFPMLHASPDYYSATLTLLSRLAWQESRVM